ncbi:HET-domain-containing protein [Zopfia rhizophila CBS 207.26]|uniref:HET-domain-containing protein n=1 Tax=Zopfia rhizophila CBS 207.26 TaxID=1314779 RepID=A0A6A6DDK0_9PEZI|nr:HET-domain-containing protein [Zopfia rhizophila CBS 207.26]
MRLINVETSELEEFIGEGVPPYAILSHTWGVDENEISFHDIQKRNFKENSNGYSKFKGCCDQAKKDGLGFAWIDTCCINKDSDRELSEAINSMFRWYRKASFCYVYLSDVPPGDKPRDRGSKFWKSRWFRRGWTLQELLAPNSLRFYNSKWCYLGTKGDLCSVVEKITNIPHPFLLSITELHAASVAQRMSWAAHRDTKRKEDLAYCLLGIFGVVIPIIYNGDGEQAFSRLQQEIMKNTRDDSILAWGLSVQEPPISDSVQVTAGRVLAAAPSDFASSGQIVAREQSTATLNFLDFSGGSLRISLSLLTTSTGNTIGLLNCGPKHDTEQVVGIPLAKPASTSSSEYVRPRGYPSVLQPIAAFSAPPKLIHIKNDSQSKKSAGANRRYWHYGDGFAEVDLDLVDVTPRSCWDQDRALIMSKTESNGDSVHQTLARFRHKEKGSRDFVIVLEFEERGSSIEARCHVMICCRSTSLEELAGKLRYMRQEVSGKRSASNGLLNLQVVLEREAREPIIIIRPEATPHPPDVTINATMELQKLHLMLEFERMQEEERQGDAEENGLNQRVTEESSRLEEIRREREMVEDELRKLEEEKRIHVEKESNGARQIHQLNERQAEVKERKERASQRRILVQKRLDELRQTNGNENGGDDYELERTLLRWAAEDGHVNVVQQLLDEGADAKSKDNHGRTPLFWAAWSGYEAFVKLLLEKGAAIESKDNRGWTPLACAALSGHEAVAKLLLEKGAAIDRKPTMAGRRSRARH